MDRRSLLAAALAAPVVICAPAVAAAHSTDYRLITAWNQRAEAFAKLWALPAGCEYQAQHPFFVVIDASEEIIKSSTATTLAGLEIQLWASLHHVHSGQLEDDVAAVRRDLGHFEAKQSALDWSSSLLISSIRSIRAITA